MPAPILTKNWTITPNLRNSFTTMTNMMGWFLYQNKVALLLSGWTVKFTCDGTTGPSGPADTTDRWGSQTAAQTRGASAAAAQSYAVLQNSDGVQLLLAYQGSADDIGRLSFSPGGLFSLATPSTNQPTATDEVVWSTGNSLVDATASLDRVMTIWTTSDTRHWSCFIARNGATVNFLGCERVSSYCGTGVFTVPYVGYRYTQMLLQNSPGAGSQTPAGAIINTAPSAAGFLGCAARVFTNAASRIVRCGGGAINVALAGGQRVISNRFFASTFPALQSSAAAPLYPIVWSGERATNLDGLLGSPIDWWICHTDAGATPAVANILPGYDVGDTIGVTPLRPNWLISLGSEAVRPWKNAAAALLLI